MTNRIMCHEHETLLKLNFFQLLEPHRSWGGVLISIYRLDAHDLKNKRKCACDKAMKKRFTFEYEFSFMTKAFQLMPKLFTLSLTKILSLELHLPVYSSSCTPSSYQDLYLLICLFTIKSLTNINNLRNSTIQSEEIIFILCEWQHPSLSEDNDF